MDDSLFNANWNRKPDGFPLTTLTWFLKESFYYFDKPWNYIMTARKQTDMFSLIIFDWN